MPGRVVLAMSGGVDSSVAAVLLKEQGYDVIGLFMRTGVTGDAPDARRESKKGCCSAIDAGDARRVADRLDIPFYALDFEAEFDKIIDYFADEYLKGRTPNPCVVCNNWLKFGQLWAFGQKLGADFIATGHYAQALRNPATNEVELHRGHDGDKDQSYVLHGIKREVLQHLLFPIGGLSKPAVRELARVAGLQSVAEKPDSVEICFVPSGNHIDVVRQRRPEVATSGVIREKDQSYVLHGIRREILPHLLFPVGGRTKAEIRAIAREAGLLGVADKPDSVDSRDRNPTIVIEPPKVEKPKEMPPLPVIYGVLGLPSGTRALMSDRAGVTGKPVHAGDMVGEFKILTLDTRDVTFQWESRVIARRVEDLIDRGSHSDAAPNVAAAAASAGAAPVATNLYDAQLRDQTARAQGNAPPLQPVTPGGSIGAEVGSAGHSERACRPGDTSPAGTVVDGYRKILISTPFGANCRWTPVQ